MCAAAVALRQASEGAVQVPGWDPESQVEDMDLIFLALKAVLLSGEK